MEAEAREGRDFPKVQREPEQSWTRPAAVPMDGCSAGGVPGVRLASAPSSRRRNSEVGADGQT